ncbi:hypothetical protein IIA15_07635 [candidate division TA06 bacterium]|nr:hypothetical protein [candidate division TA06 bacterium]
MPGIVGIVDFSREGGEPLHLTIQAMVSAMNHSRDFRLEFSVDENEGIALGRSDLPVFNKEKQPLFNEDGSLSIVYQGEIFDYSDQKNFLKKRGHCFQSNEWGEIVLHLIEEEGEDIIPDLNGAFNFAIWDKRSQKLTLANDRYGTYPFFYHFSDGKFVFASEIKAILQSKSVAPERNPRGVADWLSFGFVLGEKTLFKNIQRFPLASILHVHRGGLQKKVYWKPSFTPVIEAKNKKDWLERLDSAFKKSVLNNLSGEEKVCVALTGGLDTRAIWAAIDHKKYPVSAITFGIEECSDIQLAEKILRETKASGDFFTINNSFFLRFPEYAQSIVYLSDGHQSIQTAVQPFFYDSLREHYSILVDGGGGEFIDRFWLKHYAPFIKDDDQLRNRLFSVLNLSLDGLICKDFASELKKFSWISLNESLASMYSQVSLRDKMDIFYLQEMCGHAYSPGMNILSCFLGSRQPFFDYHFVDLVLQTPIELREKAAIHYHIILKNMPHLKKVNRSYGGIVIPFTENRISKYLPILLHRGAERFQFLRFLDSFKPVEDYPAWFRGPLKTFVKEILLDSRTHHRGYFEPLAIEKMISDHQQGKQNHWSRISALISFELCNRLFFDHS